jgi:hypothetical protein
MEKAAAYCAVFALAAKVNIFRVLLGIGFEYLLPHALQFTVHNYTVTSLLNSVIDTTLLNVYNTLGIIRLGPPLSGLDSNFSRLPCCKSRYICMSSNKQTE